MTPEKRLERDGIYKMAVSEAIGSIAKAFRHRPESFLYESDVQCCLVSKLAARLRRFPVTGTPNGEEWSPRTLGRELAVNPVKSEYPDSVLFDIALLDHELVADENIWNQPVAVAIELKLRQANGGRQDIFGDRRKLEEHLAHLGRRQLARKFAGIALVFSHRPLGILGTKWEAAGCAVNPEHFNLVWDKVTTWAICP